MKHVLCMPDSFKGTMSSAEVGTIMKDAILQVFNNALVENYAVADGGEGTVDAFLSAIEGVKREVTVAGPYHELISSFYGKMIDDVAIIEMAACAGLPLVEDHKNPELTTTYGVGQLLLKALDDGAKKIIVALGGSATNDGGCGMAAACGVRFYDSSNQVFVPTGGTLKDIVRIDVQQLDPRILTTEIVTMCDIDNPLIGPMGASAIFGPQKGADLSMVTRLDAGLSHLAEVIKKDLGKDVAMVAGAGAAGGMGAGMMAFFHSTLQMGIETVLDVIHFDDLLDRIDCIFTGEGKIDSQSLRGKVVIGISRRAKKKNVPVIAIVGSIDEQVFDLSSEGVSAMFSINHQPLPFEIAKLHSKENLAKTMHQVCQLLLLNTKTTST